MKILITGVAGTGKSAISRALNKRGGITSIDFSDIPDLCCWYNKITNKKILYSSVKDVSWLNSHERICDINKLKEVSDSHKSLVVTGVANGRQAEYFKLFDRVFLLQCNPETLARRMQDRETIWGKSDIERDYTIKWQKEFDDQCLLDGAISVNTEGALETVVDNIVDKIQNLSTLDKI